MQEWQSEEAESTSMAFPIFKCLAYFLMKGEPWPSVLSNNVVSLLFTYPLCSNGIHGNSSGMQMAKAR
jgi:hypothetical protein